MTSCNGEMDLEQPGFALLSSLPLILKVNKVREDNLCLDYFRLGSSVKYRKARDHLKGCMIKEGSTHEVDILNVTWER